MVTGYEADFYRQFGQTAKDLHRIAYATEGIVVMLKQLVELKKLDKCNSCKEQVNTK